MLNHVGLGDRGDNLWEGLQGECNSTGGGGRQISAPVLAKKNGGLFSSQSRGLQTSSNHQKLSLLYLILLPAQVFDA